MTKLAIAHPILVVGAARSGTSMAAMLLNKCGAWVGTTEQGRKENPLGFYENNWIRDGFTKPVLCSFGFDPLGIEPLPEVRFDAQGLAVNMREHLVPRLLSNDNYVGGSPWLYKDAKLALMWRLWHGAFPRARWVIVKRDREEIIESCMRTGFMNEVAIRDKQFWTQWVDEYLDRIEDLKCEVDYVEVNSGELVQGNLTTLEEAVKFCGLAWNPTNIQGVIHPEYWGTDKTKLKRIELKMGMNYSEEKILDNIKINIRRHLPQAKTYELNKQHIAIVGGGPSLVDTLPELRKQVKNGTMLVALNNTHDWLIDNGLKPSVHIMVDSRPHNVRFVQNPIPTCKYLMASQCDPQVFEALKGFNTHIFHVVNEIGEKEILDKYYFNKYYFVVGGSTVMLRGIWLMRMLGFTKMDLYGFDSCYMEGKHHAYEQVENDACEVRELDCMGKKFMCAAWMVSQYDDFFHFIKNLGDKFELNVHGDGLIAYAMNEGAKMLDDKLATTGGI